jgi:hypothetical protein
VEFLSPHVAMIPSRQSPVSKLSFRQGRFSSKWISSVFHVIRAQSREAPQIRREECHHYFFAI